MKSLFTIFPLFTGAYDDFSTSWYGNIGILIIATFFANLIVPFFLNAFHQCFFKIKVCSDRGDCSGKALSTKTITRSKFFEIHVGPEFPFEIKYSSVNNLNKSI